MSLSFPLSHTSRNCSRSSMKFFAPMCLQMTPKVSMTRSLYWRHGMCLSHYRSFYTKLPIDSHRKRQQVRFNSTSSFSSEYPGPGPTDSASDSGKLRLEYLMLELEKNAPLKLVIGSFVKKLLISVKKKFEDVQSSALYGTLPKRAQRMIVLFKMIFDQPLNTEWSKVVTEMEKENLPIYFSDMCLAGDYIIRLLER